jgi:hypothetical protein
MALGALLLFACPFACATPPTLFSQPDFESPVRGDPGDLLLLAGDGFATTDTVVYQSLGDTTQPLPTPTNVPTNNTANVGVASVVSVLNVPHSLTVSLPTVMTTDQSYALWVVNSAGEWSNGVRLNDARPIWFTPDFAYATAAIASMPRYLKVVGRNLAPAPGATTQVRLTGPATYTLTAANDNDPTTAIERYAAIVSLPASITLGTYTIEVSRDGMSWLPVADGRTFSVLADPTAPATFSVSDAAYGGCIANDGVDDTPCIVRAMAAARAAGGGSVVFGPGVWNMSITNQPGVVYFGVLVPVGINLIGAGAAATTLQRDTTWGVSTPIFTLQGYNLVQGITFADARNYALSGEQSTRPLLELGVDPGVAQAYNTADPSVVSHVTITNNVFDKPFVAVGDGVGMPIDHLFITYNTFGAYSTGINIDSDINLTDTIIDYNTFLPGSDIDVAAGGGAIPTGISSAHRVDFSNNVADGTATQYLYNPATDAKGFRAAYFWTLRGNEERELVSQNTATCSGDKAGDGEAFSFDGNHDLIVLPSLQPALNSTSNSVTVAGPLATQSDGTAYPAGYFTNFWVTIGEGPGAGQTRRPTSYSGTGPITFTVSPAWDVPPQPTSQITVARQLWQVYVVDNYVDHRTPLCQKSNANRPSGGVIELYAQSSDSAVEGNRQYDTSGIGVSMGYSVSDSVLGTAPYVEYQNFLEIRGNTIDGEYSYASNCSFSGIEAVYGATSTAGYPPPVEGYGVSISHNTVTQADGAKDGAIVFSRGGLAGPPPDTAGWDVMESTLVFQNSINNITPPLPTRVQQWPSCTANQSQRLGVHVNDGMIWHTTFAANSCNNFTNGTRGSALLIDGGTKSQRVCQGAAGNSCECPAYLQGTSATQTGTLSSASLLYPGAETAGDLNIVVVNWGNAPAGVTVTDTSGNAYGRQGSVLAVPASVTGGVAAFQAVFFAKNIAGATSNTVTATFSTPVTGAELRVLEYHGIDINSPVDVVTSAFGTGTTADGGWVTTNSGNELLLGITSAPAAGDGPGAGYVARFSDSSQAGVVEDQFVASPGAYHATAAVSPANYWMMHLFGLNLAGEGSIDTQALTAPSGLTVAAISGDAMNLSWSASTDNLGVAAYLVERCPGSACKNFAQIASVTAGTSYSDSALTSATLYTYRVRATDAAGLLSAYSGTASATATP